MGSACLPPYAAGRSLILLLLQVILRLGYMPVFARCFALDASAVEIILADWPKVWTLLGCTRVIEPAVLTPLTNPTKIVLASIRSASTSTTFLLLLCIALRHATPGYIFPHQSMHDYRFLNHTCMYH